MCEIEKNCWGLRKIVMQYAICYNNLLGAYGMLMLEGSNVEALYGMAGSGILCTDSIF